MSGGGEGCIVAASYQGSGDTTAVELWLRAREGHSTLLLVHGLRPFLEISLPGKMENIDDSYIDLILNKVRNVKDVTRIHNPVDKWSDVGIKPHWKVEVRQPYNIPKIRDELKGIGLDVSSADIIFPQRLLLDLDLGPHIGWSGEVLEKDGEIIREAGGRGLYPVDEIATCHIDQLHSIEPFAAPLVTFSFDLETSIENGRILCAAAVIQRGDKTESHTFDGDEWGILAELTRLVRESDPDIITGYNIDNFDLPKIRERMEALQPRGEIMDRAELAGWGRVPITEEACKGGGRGPPILANRAQNRVWNLAGRCVMDAWWQARMTLRPKRETLKFVSELLFPEREDLRKMDVDASRMDEEWATRPDVVLEYCERDALLPIEILDAISATARKEALAAVAKVPLETAVGGTTSQWIDSLVIRLADREGIAVPMTRRGGKSDAITGGYVHEVEAGLKEWIAVLDFKSMYPSIMISNNICHTTRVDQITESEQVNESPSGAKFLTKESREGLVPRLLQDLMAQRDHHKSMMKSATDDSQRLFHDQMQFAVKILMNSFYGVFASAFYRFTHPDIGSAITAWARSNIKKIIHELEDEGHPVVYSDTDSVFVSAPDEGKDALVNFGNELAERFTKEGAELEFETGLSAFFSHGAKKRYVGRVVWPKDDLLIRGYEVRRTDSFDLLTKTMMNTFESILDGDTNSSVQDVIALIKKIRSGKVESADLIISRSCKGKVLKDGTVDFDAVYSNPDGLPYVQAARKRIARGLQFTPGMKVDYIVIDAKKRPLTVEPWLVAETGDEPPIPDWEFYAERLARAMGRITEAFGWNEDDLLKGNRQSTLFSF